MKKIYIAGPYSRGDVGRNVHNAIKTADELMSLGYAIYCPFLCHFQHLIFPRPYMQWLAHDLQWLPLCDAVLRLPGESSGANIEEERAKELNIPIFHSISELTNTIANI